LPSDIVLETSALVESASGFGDLACSNCRPLTGRLRTATGGAVVITVFDAVGAIAAVDPGVGWVAISRCLGKGTRRRRTSAPSQNV